MNLAIILNSRDQNLRGKCGVVYQNINFDRPYSIIKILNSDNLAIKRLGGWSGVAIENQNLSQINITQ